MENQIIENQVVESQIGLNADYSDMITEKLNVYLGSIQVAYMNVRGFHWNIVGKHFFQLHSKFEELYDSLNEMADEIAERILMLGGSPVHSFSKYLKIATLRERENVSSADDTIRGVIEDTRHLLKQEREIVALASDNDDEGTVNLITDYIEKQEKLLWMYNALLK